MSFLSDRQIEAAMQDGGLEITPFRPEALQSVSYDIRMTSLVSIVDETYPPKGDGKLVRRRIDVRRPGGFQLVPGAQCLVVTEERVTLPANIGAKLDPVTTNMRNGLALAGSCLVDPGWSGALTVGLFNGLAVPVVIPARMRIGQLMFFPVEGVKTPYRGRYQDSIDIAPARPEVTPC